MVESLNIGVLGARGIPSTYSGFETFLTRLLPMLVDRGHDVTMYVRRGDVPPAKEFGGVHLKHLPAIRTKAMSTLSHGAISALAASRAGHDVVLAVNVANAPYCAFIRRQGCPVVLNTDGQEWLRGKWGRTARSYFFLCARVAHKCTPHLLTDCESMAEIYRQRFGSSPRVIPYMWTEIRSPMPTGILDRLGIGPKQYFLAGGRLVPENNLERIARAFVRLDAGAPLILLGAANYDSPTARELRRLGESAPTKLRVVGHVEDRHEFGELLAEARAYVHGHSVGGMNPSLVEAMGCGAHIVALDTPFNRDTLGEGGSYFVDFGASFDRALRSAVLAAETGDESDRLSAMRRAAREYSPSRVAGEYERLLREVASASRQTPERVVR